MPLFHNKLFLNSTIAFALAGMVATTLHELSHLVAGTLLGQHATLYSNAVDFGAHVSKNHQIITAATGPLFSLASGLLILALSRTWSKGFGRLFWMWLGFISAQTGFGYFLIAPFAHNGDTGKVLNLLNGPSAIYLLSFVLGSVGTLWLSRRFAHEVLHYTDGTIKTMRPFGIFSWLFGTLLLVLIYMFAVRNLPSADQVVCLFGVATTGIFAPMFSFFWRKLKGVKTEDLNLSTPKIGIAVTVIVAVLIVIVLGNGINI